MPSPNYTGQSRGCGTIPAFPAARSQYAKAAPKGVGEAVASSSWKPRWSWGLSSGPPSTVPIRHGSARRYRSASPATPHPRPWEPYCPPNREIADGRWRGARYPNIAALLVDLGRASECSPRRPSISTEVDACTLDGSENTRRGVYLAEMDDEKWLGIANWLWFQPFSAMGEANPSALWLHLSGLKVQNPA